MRVVHVAVSLFVIASLAGCAGDPQTQSEDDTPVPSSIREVEVTETTGAIRGVVVSEAIAPIEGVRIELNTGMNRTTDVDGAFVFNGLEPGPYFLTASKLGYHSVQASADVVAGETEPPITKVLLAVDQAAQPFTEMLQWSGFLGCGFGTNFAGLRGGASVNPCAADAIACDLAGVCLLNTANTHTFDFGGGRVPDHAQAEMTWDGTQAFGDGLNLGWFDSGTADFKSISGESPLILPTNRTEIIEAHDENITSLLVRVFPGTGSELTVSLQQRFDVFVTYFYGFTPREGWAFSIDGQCFAPEDCT